MSDLIGTGNNLFTEGTLTPMPGKDYKNKKEVEEAFRANHLFKMNHFSLANKPCSITNFAKGAQVSIRYKNNRSVTIIKV